MVSRYPNFPAIPGGMRVAPKTSWWISSWYPYRHLHGEVTLKSSSKKWWTKHLKLLPRWFWTPAEFSSLTNPSCGAVKKDPSEMGAVIAFLMVNGFPINGFCWSVISPLFLWSFRPLLHLWLGPLCWPDFPKKGTKERHLFGSSILFTQGSWAEFPDPVAWVFREFFSFAMATSWSLFPGRHLYWIVWRDETKKYTKWKVDGPTPLHWFIMAGHGFSPPFVSG